jgi:hypothetical protein
MPMVVRWDGFLDKDKVEKTFKKLIHRHESFKTSVEIVGRQPIQRIHEHLPFELEYFDLTNDGDPVIGISEQEIVDKFFRGFVLSQAPLLRSGLIKRAEETFILMLDHHHIISDGTSMGILEQEFRALYAGEELPPLRLQYKDFSAWQSRLFESGTIKKQEEYWLNLFKGEIPFLNLPLDYPRPAVYAAKGNRITFEISRELTGQARQLMLETETTMYMVLLAVYTIMLSKYSGQDNIIVGTPIAGRKHTDLENIIGLFINMLAMKNKPQEEKTFVEFLQEVKTNALNAYENQDYQFEDLVLKLKIKVESGRNPLFDAVFVLQNIVTKEIQISNLEELRKIHVSPYGLGLDQVHHELLLNAVETNNTLLVALEYSTELFKGTTAQQMTKHYIEVFEQILENREIKLKDIYISHDLILAKPCINQEEDEDFRF